MRYLLIIGLSLFVSGAILVVTPHLLRSISQPSNVKKSELLAELSQVIGEVQLKAPERLAFQTGRPETSLANFYRVRTASGSQADLKFPSGESLRLQAHSEIVLEKAFATPYDRKIIVHVLRGQIEPLGSPRSPTTESDGVDSPRYTIEVRNPERGVNPSNELSSRRFVQKRPISLTKTPAQPFLDSSGNLSSAAKVKQPRIKEMISKTLSNEYIYETISEQRANFRECYLKHLKNNPASRGSMRLAFTINPNGKVSKTSILETTIADQAFGQCITTVLSRCKFRPFDASPIVAQYPITFE